MPLQVYVIHSLKSTKKYKTIFALFKLCILIKTFFIYFLFYTQKILNLAFSTSPRLMLPLKLLLFKYNKHICSILRRKRTLLLFERQLYMIIEPNQLDIRKSL